MSTLHKKGKQYRAMCPVCTGHFDIIPLTDEPMPCWSTGLICKVCSRCEEIKRNKKKKSNKFSIVKKEEDQ